MTSNKRNMTDHDKPLLSIQQISLKLDIPRSTLRFWEKELAGFILPVRTSGGQRRYGLEDLSIIGKVKECRARGMSLSEIKVRLSAESQDVVKQSQLGNIDLLAERVAAVIKAEIYTFLSEQAPVEFD